MCKAIFAIIVSLALVAPMSFSPLVTDAMAAKAKEKAATDSVKKADAPKKVEGAKKADASKKADAPKKAQKTAKKSKKTAPKAS